MIPNYLLELSFKKLNEELREDLNGKKLNNDITSNFLLNKSSNLRCVISNREKLILCGTSFIKNFLDKSFPEIKVKSSFDDGMELKENSKIFYISGNAKMILALERTVLK